MDASQMARSIEQQGAVQVVFDAEPKASSSCTDFQPLPSPVDQQFTAVDRNLCDAFADIETSRQNLYNCKATVTALNKRCGTFEQSYKSLCPLYEKAVNDLHKMVNKNLSLHQELGGAEKTVETLETRIRGLEDEKSKMIQEHESALADVTNCLNATERKIVEIEKTWTTGSSELGFQLLSPEPMVQTASPELIWSPSTGERNRTSGTGNKENHQQQGEPPKKSRKRKQGSNAKARDA